MKLSIILSCKASFKNLYSIVTHKTYLVIKRQEKFHAYRYNKDYKEASNMEWINIVQKALNYMEDHLLDDIHSEQIAEAMYISNAYFQKTFKIVTGLSVSDYLRNRRLSLAGEELLLKNSKVMDTALKYGYESSESFTKAFTRFHGITPSVAQKTAGKLRYFSPLNIEIHIDGGFIMSRRLIPNVEKLYENKAEKYMFPSCMRSAMSALNEDENYDFVFFAAVCGDFFTQTWLEPKWRYNDSYSNVWKDQQLPIQQAFDACGYEYTYVRHDEIVAKEEAIQKQIVESIDKGLPVLSFGIVGPPVCSIICGYSEDGKVLIGWSQFSGEMCDDEIFDHVFSKNYFQVRNQLKNVEALIFFGKKKKRETIAENMEKAILRIKDYKKMVSTEEVYFGKAAFDAWADSLLCDEDFQTEQQLEGPLDTYRSCVVQTGTNLYHIEDFLRRAQQLCPNLTNEIQHLQEGFQQEKEAFEKLIAFQGGYFFERDRKALLDAEFRKTLSQHVKRVGECYQKAIEEI